MKVLMNQSYMIEELLGREQIYYTDKNYIKSEYLFTLKTDSGLMVYNALTASVILIEGKESIDNITSENELKLYVNSWMYLDEDFDVWGYIRRRKEYLDTKRKERAIGAMSDKFVVATTMACNAACTYCYEAGVYPRSMDKDTALDVAKYIYENSIGHLGITWFGGEPLCNPDVIDVISEYLREKELSFKSLIISNGYYIDQYIDKIINDWHVFKFQITLDGTREEYLKAKNYKNDDPNAFDKVLNNIQLLLDNNIKVSIRFNITLYNSEDISDLIDYLLDRFSEYTKLTMYPAALYIGLGNPPLELTPEEDMFVADRVAMISDKLQFNKRYVPRVALNYDSNEYCMCNSYKIKAIGTSGNRCTCEHNFEETRFGTVTDPINDLSIHDELNKKIATDEDREECKSCWYMPLCNKLTHCPVSNKCSPGQRKETDRLIELELKRVYENYVNNGKYVQEYNTVNVIVSNDAGDPLPTVTTIYPSSNEVI